MFSNKFVTDIKTFFDSIRNIGLCVALTIGLPFIEKSANFYCENTTFTYAVVTLSVALIVFLYFFNLVWLFSSQQGEVMSKLLYILSLITIMGLITVAIGGAAFVEVWGKLKVYG